MLGFFIVFLLGTITTWRNVAIICLFLPIITMIVICFVSPVLTRPLKSSANHSVQTQIPETPLWLLSKNRTDEALKSLQWLRGWVSPRAVSTEFAEMQRYSENSNSCICCQKAGIKCVHSKPDLKEKMKELVRKRTMRPFAVVLLAFAIAQFSGMTSIRPYMVQLFKTFSLPIDSNWATVCIWTTTLYSAILNFLFTS